MNKKLGIILGIVLVLLITGGVAYLSMKKTNSGVYNAPTIAQNNTPSKPTSMQGTLKSLLAQGISQKCTYSGDGSTTGATVNGTVELSGGKMRGDFTSSSSQVTVNGHMVVDSGFTYFWTDTSNQGFKIAMDTQTPSPAAGSKAVDMNQSVKYSCQPWTTDATTFTLPANITFNTMTAPVMAAPKAAGNPGINSNANMCAACNNIPAGPGRTACMTQLHCQ